MASDRTWSAYLLQCADGSLYCGVTKNIEKRLMTHNEGTASKYTRSRLPVSMVATREKLTKREAYQLEYKIKKTMTYKKIETLINWNFEK